MTLFLNECAFVAVSEGTVDFEVERALTGFYTPAECTSPAVTNGAQYYYRAETDDLSQYETGIGTYDAATETLARTTVLQSSSGGSKVNFADIPSVRIELLAQAIGTLASQNADAVAITGGSLGSAVTAVTQSPGNSSTAIATTAFITSALSALTTVYQPLDSDLTSIAALTTTSYGRSVLELANAGAAQTLFGVDPAGTDNSTDVTLAGSYDYLTLSGQQITLGQIDLSTDVTGALPAASVSIADAGGLITATTVEGALAENRTAIDAIEADYLTSADIGSTVQAYDADLASWAGVTRASGFDTFVATPSSANLKSLVTDETGSGALVFATSPTLVTPNIGAATGASLSLSSGTGLTIGSSVPFSDSAGTLTLQNVDTLDATTEATIEAAIDTLANLTSVQGRTVTLTDAGADAIFGWDDSANAYENLTATEVKTAVGLTTSSTDNAAVRFDSTSGNTQNSALLIPDDSTLVKLDWNGSELLGLAGMVAIPQGYVMTDGLNFRFDCNETYHIYDRLGATLSVTTGTNPGTAALASLFTYTNGYINLNTYKNGSNNWTLEVTGISIHNSSNTTWRPYVLFHSSGANAGNLLIEFLEGDGTTWTTVYNGACRDWIAPQAYTTFATGILKGMRFTFTGISGNSYLKMLGATSTTSPSYVWNMMNTGGSFYGAINGYSAGTETWSISKTGAAQFDSTGSFSGVLSALSSIELGHASDTTLSRASAGRLAIEGVNVVTVSSTDTLTNKTMNWTSNTFTLTSAQLAAACSDETGSGSLVFGTSPSFTTDIRPVSNDGASLGISGTAFSDLFLASGAVINFNAGDATITHASSNTMTFAGALWEFTYSAAANTPALLATNAAATAANTAFIVRTSRASPANNDRVLIEMQATNSGAAFKTAAAWAGAMTTVTASSEQGAMYLQLSNAGTVGDEYLWTTTAYSPAANDGATLGTTSLKWSDLFLADGSVINWNSGDITLTHSSNALAFAGGVVDFDQNPTIDGNPISSAYEFNVLDYGAVGDDSTDNTAAFQNCLDDIYTSGGGCMVIPNGIFRSGPLTYDVSGISSAYTHRLKIRGAQKTATQIKMVGNSGTLFTYTGNTGNLQVGYLQLESFSMVGDLTSGSGGCFIDSAAFCSFKDFVCNAFDTNFEIIDVDQGDWTGCTFRFGNEGLVINNGSAGTTGPNSLVFTNCNISNNSTFGVYANNLQACTFIGGSIQYNGTVSTSGASATPGANVGSSTYWGFKSVHTDALGYGTVNFIGVIFEGNTGKSDFWAVDASGSNAQIAYNFIGCSFLRIVYIDSTVYYHWYGTNNILLDGSASNVNTTLDGNTFIYNSDYTVNAARPVVSNANANAKIFDRGSNIYQSSTEAPSWAGNWADIGGSGFQSVDGSAAAPTYSFYNDPDTGMYSGGANTLRFATNGTGRLTLTDAVFAPLTNDGIALGTSSLGFADLFLASGSVIDFNASDITMTHSSNKLALAGGVFTLTPNANATQATSTTYALQILDTTGAAVELTAGYDGTSAVIQSWNGLALDINPQGNTVKVNGYGLTDAWTSYSPTPTPASGSYTNVTCSGSYKRIGKTVHWRGTVTFTDIGTGSGYCQVTLPGSTTAAGNETFTAIEWNSGGDVKSIFLASGTTYIRIYTPPGFGSSHASGDAIPFCITYECS